ncbi:transcriptional regulator for fatty acid degradation FadR GntR family [Photobacterium aphoticum]|uniref:Transcriptional regulator for fatty acid degradation FadR GntR family n=1 Tax=Photobacterium aphoticum TaxID=754436 RepID=A0A090R080_9GAMM|nr:transcriptional regulator for fatty acid degradation FadR GntR family [Photobacterium aphoticum]
MNNYMDTSGLSILDTLITLDGQDVQGVLEDLLSARTDISSVYMRYAVKGNSDESAALIDSIIEECERLLQAESFADYMEASDIKAELTQEVKKSSINTVRKILNCVKRFAARAHSTTLTTACSRAWQQNQVTPCTC